MVALTPEESFLEAVELVQSIELESGDYAGNQRVYAEHSQICQRIAYETGQVDDPWMLNYEITNGKVLKLAATVGLGFLSGGILGGAIALAGGIFGVGGKRKNANEAQKKEEEKFNQTYGIDSGGQLAIAGTPVQMAFGNRNLSIDADGNKCGGVRVGGLLLGSSILTSRGANYLRQLWALSSGADPATGLGQVRFIASDEILFDKQSRTKFTRSEVQTLARAGTDGQSPIPWFSEYSQNLSPQNYNVFGIDRRAVVESSANGTDVSVQNGVNVSFSPDEGHILKNSSVDAWNAYAWSEDTVRANGYLQFVAAQIGPTRAAGLCGYQGAVSWQDLDHGFYFTSNGYAIVESGRIVVPEPGVTYGVNTLFKIVISAAGDRLSYLLNNNEVYVSSIRPAANLYANILFKSPSARFNSISTSSQTGGIKGANIRRTNFTAVREEFERLNSVDSYALCNGQIGRDATRFEVLEKNASTRQLITDSLVNLDVGTPIYAFWIGKYETTKHVTSVYFNLAFNVFARTEDNSQYTTFGVIFDIWVRRAGETQAEEDRLGRFYVRSRTPTTQYRSIHFRNFPLGRYYFEFQPRCANTGDEAIFELTDNGTVNEDLTPVVIDGNTVSMRGEFNRISDAGNVASSITAEMSYTGRSQVSSEQGPTGRIASVNEQVAPIAIANPASGLFNAYERLALLAIQYRASDRIQQNPGISTPLWECKSIPNLMAAGTSSGLSTNSVLNDPTTSFGTVKIGWILRNLSKRSESRIIGVAGTTLQTAVGLNWAMGDRYLVYFVGASPYFPDICAYVSSSHDGGAGDKIDRDLDIDYDSFVYARSFCVRRKFYWNDLVQAPAVPIKQWVEREARGSLLIPGTIDGRWALFPDEVTGEEPQVFNASNARNASTEWADWTDANVNRLIVKYTDGRDLFEEDGARFRTKIVTIQTTACFNGSENPVEQTLDLPAVTTPLQAAEVGVAAFNSAIQQTRTVAFDTSLQAVYLQGGKLIRFQHSLLDVGEAMSSFVAEVEPLNVSTQKIRLSEPPTVYEGLTGEDSTTGAAFVGTNLSESPIDVGDLLINVTRDRAAIITSKNDTKLNADLQCDRGDLIRVLNLTKLANMRAAVTFRADGNSQDNLDFSFERRDRSVWLVVSGLNQAIAPLDPVNISSSAESLYRVQKIQPSGKSLFKISAVFHPGLDLYSRVGLVVSYDDQDFFG